MTAFQDFLTDELAALTRIVPAPSGGLGYGTDLACVQDISSTLAETQPTSAQGIRESVLRRLQTPRGFLTGIEDDGNYGFDVVGLLNTGTSLQDLRSVEASIRDEVSKDDRVATSTVSAAYTLGTSTLQVSVLIVARDPSIGQFSLVFSVDKMGRISEELS